MTRRISIYASVAAMVFLVCSGLAGAQDFNAALDQAWLNFATSGNASWSVDSSNASPGGGSSSARSGAITDSQTSSLSVEVTGPATMTFYWKVSCEPGFDALRLYVDGVLSDAITGDIDWVQKSFPVAAGSHTIEWRYQKDSSGTEGDDAGWVDDVQLDPLYVASIEFTREQAAVVDPLPSNNYYILNYNYSTEELEWRDSFVPTPGALQIVEYDLARDEWHGLFLYDADAAQYTEAQYPYRTVLHDEVVTDASTNVPVWDPAALSGSPSSTLRFSGSSALCGVDVPVGQSGFVLFYDYGRLLGTWETVAAPGTYAIEYLPADYGEWICIYIYNTLTGTYEEDTMYVYSESLSN